MGVPIPEMVPIAGDAFIMGRDHGRPDASPAHRVVLGPFLAATAPVTNEQYLAFCREIGVSPPPFLDDQRFAAAAQPAVGINWFEAVAYCEWLRGAAGIRARLPTEAEREFAALGGLPGGDWPWRGPHHPAAAAIDASDGPHPPGEDCANGYGLRCMAENVHEWCSDWYSPQYYRAAAADSPSGPPVGTRRASRGGSWRHRQKVTAVHARSSLDPSFHYSDFGFRVFADPAGTIPPGSLPWRSRLRS